MTTFAIALASLLFGIFVAGAFVGYALWRFAERFIAHAAGLDEEADEQWDEADVLNWGESDAVG